MRKKYIFNLLIIFPLITFAQNDSSKRNAYLIADIAYPIPSSGSTFNRVYDGMFDITLGYGIIRKKIILGGNVGFSYFRVSPKVLELNGTMTILSPGLNIGYEFNIFKKTFIRPLLRCGYDFITFNGKDTNGNARPSYHEGGLSLSPMITAGYFFSKKFGVGLNGSYKVIFQHFGNKFVQEENTTRIMSFGISILYKL